MASAISDKNKCGDPLTDPKYRAPGFFENFREAVFGIPRPLACVQIEVTSACTAACSYCPHTTQAASWKTRHIQPEVFARLWPILRQSQRAHLQGWGEPLLHPRFFDLQQFARKAGCATSITTCGMYMNREIAARIAASGMDIVAFSLAGTDEASNAVRAKAPFEQVCASIRAVRQAINNSENNTSENAEKPEIHLAYLLLADRMEAVNRLPDLMDQLDVEMAVISTLDYIAEPGMERLAFATQESDKIAKARELLERAAAEAEKRGRVIHFSLPQQQTVKHGCRENIGRSLFVDGDGHVSPCVYLNVPGSDGQEKRKVFGNVANMDPLAIWARDDYKEFRKNLLTGRSDAVCFGCPKRQEG